MSKLEKQEREKLRIAIKRQYDEEVKELRERSRELEAVKRENSKLREENDELRSKLASYEEWIERMQEYCNFSEEELEGLKSKAVADKKFVEIMSLMGKLTGVVGLRL